MSGRHIIGTRPGWRGHLMLPLACLSLIFVYGLTILHDEWRIMLIMRAQVDQAAGRRDADQAKYLAHDAERASVLPARGAMARAIIRLRAATREQGRDRRRTLITDGFADARRADTAMPYSGEAALTMAYAHVLRDGAESPMALRHFVRSYAAHPYLSDSAEWRLRYAVRNWVRLDPATRAAVVSEGRWLQHIGPNGRTHVYVLTGGSPLWHAIAEGSAPGR